MKIIVLLIIGFVKKVARNLYWILNLIKTKKGTGSKLGFPIKIEGKGRLAFGKNCSVSKNTFFAIGNGCEITLGNNCRIDEGVEIIAGKDAIITFGDNCWIMKNSIIRTKNEFLFANNVIIATNCAIFSREGGYEGVLEVGYGTHIGDNTIIDVSDNLVIGAEVAIGPKCVIYTHDHDYSKSEKAAWKGGVISKPVAIKQYAWIGSGVTLLPGIEIAERSVIGAGAVVTKKTESNSIYGGVPAKKIRSI